MLAVKDRVNAIALAPAEDFRRDSDLFGEGVRNPEAQSRIQAAMKRGFQTRDAEMALARMLGDLTDRGSNTYRAGSHTDELRSGQEFDRSGPP